MCDRTSHPEKCPHARTSHALSGIGFRTHFRTHIARAKVRYYAHVRRNPTSAHSNPIVYDFENLEFKFSLMPTVFNDFENFNFKLFSKALCSKWSENSNSIFSLLMPIVVNDLENLKYKYFHNAKPLVCADFCPRLHAHRTHFHSVWCKRPHPHPHAHKKRQKRKN